MHTSATCMWRMHAHAVGTTHPPGHWAHWNEARFPAQLQQNPVMQALSRQRADAAAFDASRLVDFAERVRFAGPAAQLSPLVREAGRLVITDARLYFQPLHNATGDAPVRARELAHVAAVARRRSSLRPTGAGGFSVKWPFQVTATGCKHVQ